MGKEWRMAEMIAEKRIDRIPFELQILPQWVNWKTEIRNGKPTKIPLNPKTLGNAMSNNSDTWGSFESALSNYNDDRGIGFVLTEDDPYTALDLDGCRNPETGYIEPWAMGIIQKIKSYSEVSPSGTGIRMFAKCELPEGPRKIGRLEIYDCNRFMTVTGHVLDGITEIRTIDGDELHRFLMQVGKDQQIVDKAKSASNGEKFQALWNGDWSGYSSQSEADMALVSILYFHTKDKVATDRLFRKSGLMRAKWNEKHFADGRTYGKKLIEEVSRGDNNKSSTEDTARNGHSRSEKSIKVVSLREFLNLEFPPRENIINPWLPTQGLALLYGLRGIGKTLFAMWIAMVTACTGKFLKWEAEKPYGVLYIDGEMPAVVDQERFSNLVISVDIEPMAPLKLITPDLQEWGMPDLSTIEGQQLIEPHLEGISLVIVDNISTLCRQGRENEAESWLPVQEWGLRLRSKHISVLFVHHSGKGGLQRGTSRREDVLDTIIALKRPQDYLPNEGARFEVHFEKARNLHGDEVKPFEAKLTTVDGKQIWLMKNIEDSLTYRVAELLNEGVAQYDIPDILGVSKGTVSKHKYKAKTLGLLRGGK